MRNLKKFLALVLAMVMAMSLMVTANAATDNKVFPDGDKVTPAFEEAVAVLSGMKVFQGDNAGNFNPGQTITRAEVAAIIYRIVTGDVTDNQAKLYRNVNHGFVDVTPDKWYAGYVGYLWNAKIIKGDDQSRFNPSSTITGHEVLAMILRAVGYDANNEFTGATWRITVASTAQEKGVLDDINKTNYGADTLYNAARRDVVASLVFRTVAYVPQVQWTTAFSYRDDGMIGAVTGGAKNPTLGYREFGLSVRQGIIVGNQSTGESNTVLGVEIGLKNSSGGTTLTWAGNRQSSNSQYNPDTNEFDAGAKNYGVTGVSYMHDNSSATPLSDITSGDTHADSVRNPAHVGLEYSFKTDLGLYGHKVNMWYDGRTSTANAEYDVDLTGSDTRTYTIPSKYSKAYTAFDLAEMDEVIFATDTDLRDDTGTNPIYLAATKAGFSDTQNGTIYVSDRYGIMDEDVYAAQSASQSLASGKSMIHMYRLIANESDKKYDVVIKLNQEVANISQVNDTATVPYIVLGYEMSNPNRLDPDSTAAHSHFGRDDVIANNTDGGVIENRRLSPDSIKTLGTTVIATQIIRTNSTNSSGTPTNRGARGNTDTTNYKMWLYDVQELKPAFTGTIASYMVAPSSNLVQQVTLSSTEQYDLSGITGSTTSVYGPADLDDYNHLLWGSGVTYLEASTIQVGMSYNFYTDAAGRFIGVGVPNDYEFVYTTFADYEIGALGTGTSGYYVYGVDWDGNKVLNKQVKNITVPYATYNGIDVFTDWATDPINTTTSFYSNSKMKFLTAYGYVNAAAAAVPGTIDVYNGTLENGLLGNAYSILPVTLRDQGGISSTIYGNQIREGNNTRFLLDSEGNLTWVDTGAKDYGTRFVGWYDGTKANGTWAISSSDASNGFLRVYNQTRTLVNNAQEPVLDDITSAANNVDYVLTNSTKFIVVTGSGTSDLNVETFTGLSGLLNGASGAEITFDGGDNVYFKTVADDYGNATQDQNRTITTVIMSDTNLHRYTSQSLYFSAPGNVGYTTSYLTGVSGNVRLYTLYNNGVKGEYWIDEDLSTDTDGGNTAKGTAQYGDFYTLAKVRTHNGQPIYKATCVSLPSGSNNYDLTTTGCYTGINIFTAQYNYVAVNEMNTAEIGNKVYNVTGAVVAEAFGTNTPISGVSTIDTLMKLNRAVAKYDASGRTTETYNVTVAYVYDGVNVPCIYVIDIQAGV